MKPTIRVQNTDAPTCHIEVTYPRPGQLDPDHDKAVGRVIEAIATLSAYLLSPDSVFHSGGCTAIGNCEWCVTPVPRDLVPIARKALTAVYDHETRTDPVNTITIR